MLHRSGASVARDDLCAALAAARPRRSVPAASRADARRGAAPRPAATLAGDRRGWSRRTSTAANWAAAETTTDLALRRDARPDLLGRGRGRQSRAPRSRPCKRIVYHPFWHIVRLRVLDASGRVLADFGGPDVIAPVSGTLRSAPGATDRRGS